MSIFSIGQSSEPIFIFGDDEDMNWCGGSDISKGKYSLIFIYDVGWYLFVDQFIENGLPTHSERYNNYLIRISSTVMLFSIDKICLDDDQMCNKDQANRFLTSAEKSMLTFYADTLLPCLYPLVSAFLQNKISNTGVSVGYSYPEGTTVLPKF